MRRDQSSDMFSLHGVGGAIPEMGEVPVTPEEKRNKRLLILLALLAVVAAGSAVTLLLLWLSHESTVEEAVLAVSDEGRTSAAERAMNLMAHGVLGEGGNGATQARLAAAVAFEADPSWGNRAAELTGNVADDMPDPEVASARAYVALCRGDLEAATEAASAITPSGAYAADHFRVRALATLAMGDLPAAHENASHAYSQREGSPRHAALVALILARSGSFEDAAEVLDGVGEATPAIRVARAIALADAGEDFERAGAEARGVLDAPDATPVERAWASVISARVAVEAGERDTARARVDEAVESAPLGDEVFRLATGELLLELGDTDEAAQTISELSADGSADGTRRAILRARIALARNDLDATAAALENAQDSPRTSLVRGILAERRDEHESARGAFEAAARDPRIQAEALRRLARMELALERATEAVAAATRLLAAAPDDPEHVFIAVVANVDAGRAQPALDLADSALAAHPGVPRLLAARALALGALERWDDALPVVRTAVEAAADNPDLHAIHGDAARRAGETAEAAAAFERALALEADHPQALVGSFALALDGYELETAAQLKTRIDALPEIESAELDRLQARFLVSSVVGQEGVQDVRRLIQAHERDSELWLALGELHLQAEQYTQALQSFAHALENEDTRALAALGRALSQARQGRKRGTENALADLDDTDVSSLPAWARARREIIDGFLELHAARHPRARAAAHRALRVDRRSGQAQHLLALVVAASERDPARQLRASLAGRDAPPDAWARRALSLDVGDEACALGRRYRNAAPRGALIADVNRMLTQCRAAGQ